MLLTLISMPSYVNMYKFLIDTDKFALQKIYEEQDLHNRIEQTNEVFSSFVSKLELWNKLEHNYDFKQDQAKTQKKLEEIYESLKKHFSRGDDG